MTITAKTITAFNHEIAKLDLTDARINELPIEANQLKDAIENVGHRMVFDTEPASFKSTLLELADRKP